MGAAQSTTSATEQQPAAAVLAPVVAASAPLAAIATAQQQRKPVGEVSKKEEEASRFDGKSFVGRRPTADERNKDSSTLDLSTLLPSTFPTSSPPPPPHPPKKQAPPPPAKLYRFVPDPRGDGRGGSWDLVDAAASPSFFDASEDSSSASSKARWFLEVGSLSAPVSDEYSADAAERRVTMAVESGEGDEEEEEEERGIRGGGARASSSAPSVFALRFSDARAFRAFLDRYDECVFQNTYGRPGGAEGRAAAFGEDSVLNLGLDGETAASAAAWAAGDDEMPDAGGSSDEEEEEDGDFDRTPPTAARVGGVPDGIRGLRLGAGERSYLVREGGRIEALRNVAGGVRPMEGGPVSFVLTPPAGGGGSGGGGRSSRLRSSAAAAAAGAGTGGGSDLDLTPGKMLLMRHETRLAALSASRPDRLLDADIETGRVVSEWRFEKDGVEVPMDDLANESRGAQLDGRSTFLGLAANRLVKWDMRTRGGVVANSPSSSASASSPVVEWAGGKDYARGTRFSCLATAGDGSCVVGSADGQVRLFSDRSLSRAATSLPGLGAPVTSVDVTFDGKWALATTARYLMVLKTSWLDPESGKVVSAFKQRMGRSAPAPRLLKLRPEDVAATGGAPLSKGKFTWVATPDAPKEGWIAASCGTHTVLWSFDAVKRARAGGERGGGASGDGGGGPTATLGGRGGGGLSSAGGLTTVPPTYLLSKGESVVDSVLMHDRFATGGSGGGTPARGGGEGRTPGGGLSTPTLGGGRRGGTPAAAARGTPGALAGTPGGGGEHASMVILTRQGIFSTAEGGEDDEY